MTRSPAPNPGTGDNREPLQHCATEVDCMEYPSYCEENEEPCPFFNCKKRSRQSTRSSRPVAASRPPPDCKKYMTYRADSGHLYHLLYDLTGTMYNEETLDIGLMKVRNMWDVRADRDAAIRNEVLEGLQKIFARNYDDGIYKDQYAAFHAAKDEYLRNTGTSDKGGE